MKPIEVGKMNDEYLEYMSDWLIGQRSYAHSRRVDSSSGKSK